MQPKQVVRHAGSTQHGQNVRGPRVAQRLPWPRVALVKLASMPRVAHQLEKTPWPRVARVKWAPQLPRVA